MALLVWEAAENWPEAWTNNYFSPIVAGGAYIHDYVVYVSGFEGGGTLFRLYRYNISQRTWTRLADPTDYVSSAISMSISNTLLCVPAPPHPRVMIYNIAADTWTLSSDAPQILATDVEIRNTVWVDDDTIWAFVRNRVGGVWRTMCYRYVVSTDTWTAFVNVYSPVLHNPQGMGISPDLSTLYFGQCGATYHDCSKYTIATDTYAAAVDIGAGYYFILCSDRNRLWYGDRALGFQQITGYMDLFDESLNVVFPSNANRDKPTNISAGIYDAETAIVWYRTTEPKNWSYVTRDLTVTPTVQTDVATEIT